MLKITAHIEISMDELQISFMRSSGPGGQNVNKVETAVMLRFNIRSSSSLAEEIKERILLKLGASVTSRGDIIIKANRYRTQERNKQDAIERLQEILKNAVFVAKNRKKTKPTYASKLKRLEKKKLQSKTKSMRGKVNKDD